jgi:dimethylglycine dehydrogenase
MKSNYKAVVIGGGIVGVSVLYHLAKFGWKDVALLERKQLTAGSTWHAAAGFHSMNGDVNMARLQTYTINLYKEVEKISGQDVGLHVPGSVKVASSDEKWTYIKNIHALNKTMGIESVLLTPEEIAEKTPLMDTSMLKGGMWDANEGHLDPYGATHAFAKAARKEGAEVHTQTLVTELNQQADGSWEIVTDKGTIHAEHIVNAAGLWAREVGHMAGVNLPLMPYEHHYLVTEDIPVLETFGKESPVIDDMDGEIYVRQEGKGALYGVYEKGPVPWSVKGTPWDYGESDLLPPRLDDLMDTLEKGFKGFPAIAEAGIKNVINGPFTFTPDGNPLVGPVPGAQNFWSACGVMTGFSQCGGIGLTLAQWMIDGEPEGDVYGMDVARYGEYATQPYVVDTTTQFYETRLNLPFPNEAYPAGRPHKTTPIYDVLKNQNAVFGEQYGQEFPMWFAPEGEKAEDIPSFQRHNNSFESVKEECLTVREACAVLDASSFSKYEITGPGARAWLDKLIASKLPNPGRAKLAVMLSEKGKIMGDFTLMCFAEDRFMLTGSGQLQTWHMRWFNKYLPADGVDVRNVTDALSALSVVGPKSRELLEKLTLTDVSNDAFKFLAVKEMNVGYAPAKVARMSLTGEMGYEIYVPSQYMRSVYLRIMEAGKDLGIRNIGVRALLSLRLEKGYGIWSREFSPDYTPSMNEMAHFVDYDKEGFVGRDAALIDAEKGPLKKLVMLEVDSDDADVMGNEPIMIGERLVGYVTSGGYGCTVAKSLAMAYIDVADLDSSTEYGTYILGERKTARLLDKAPYDPTGSVMRK